VSLTLGPPAAPERLRLRNPSTVLCVRFRTLVRWKIVESSIKQAEIISVEAQIPAINELRYASRQLFNAIIHLDDPDLAEGDKEKIKKRIMNADQYLYNAEHDIADSIVTFYRKIIVDIEERFGRNIITTYCPQYPMFREHIRECERLIAETRGNYELRGENYAAIRNNHVPHLLELHDKLIDAQVSAEEERQRTRREILIAHSRIRISYIVIVVLGIIAIMEPVYLWYVTPEAYCLAHKATPILKWLCR
jgi:hypothetical protein